MELSLEQHMIAFSHCKSPLGLNLKKKKERNNIRIEPQKPSSSFFLSNNNFNKVTLLFEH